MQTPNMERVRAVRPSKKTIAMRQFVPWQIIRFLVINLMMTRMILRSHDHKL